MIVVDCSVVVDALTRRELGWLRRRLSGRTLHAPALLDYEVLSAIRGLALGGALSAARATDAVGDFGDLQIRRQQATGALRADAWRLRDRMTSYDASYVALARALDAPLWTLDVRLDRAAAGEVEVVVPRE